MEEQDALMDGGARLGRGGDTMDKRRQRLGTGVLVVAQKKKKKGQV